MPGSSARLRSPRGYLTSHDKTQLSPTVRTASLPLITQPTMTSQVFLRRADDFMVGRVWRVLCGLVSFLLQAIQLGLNRCDTTAQYRTHFFRTSHGSPLTLFRRYRYFTRLYWLHRSNSSTLTMPTTRIQRISNRRRIDWTEITIWCFPFAGTGVWTTLTVNYK